LPHEHILIQMSSSKSQSDLDDSVPETAVPQASFDEMQYNNVRKYEDLKIQLMEADAEIRYYFLNLSSCDF